MEGGKVVNLSVELNGQLPLQVYARPIEEARIVLRSIDLGVKTEISSFEELNSYDQPGDGFSIPKAALVLAGFGHKFSGKQYPDLAAQMKDFGCGIEMSLLSAVPKGSGLGTSSNLAATVLGTLNEFCALGWDKHAIAYRTLILEIALHHFHGARVQRNLPGDVHRGPRPDGLGIGAYGRGRVGRGYCAFSHDAVPLS